MVNGQQHLDAVTSATTASKLERGTVETQTQRGSHGWKAWPRRGCLSPGWEGSLSLQETSTDSDLLLKMVLYHITVSVIKFYRVHAWNNVKESHLPD